MNSMPSVRQRLEGALEYDYYTREDFERGMEVAPATINDWLKAMNGLPRHEVPHVKGEHVVPLSDFAPMHWGLQ